MARTLIACETEMYAGAGVEPGDVFREAVVVRRTEEGSRVASFDLAAPDGAEPLREFLPGQYISVGVVLAAGARQLRRYSLSVAPRQRRWRFTACREPGT